MTDDTALKIAQDIYAAGRDKVDAIKTLRMASREPLQVCLARIEEVWGQVTTPEGEEKRMQSKILEARNEVVRAEENLKNAGIRYAQALDKLRLLAGP